MLQHTHTLQLVAYNYATAYTHFPTSDINYTITYTHFTNVAYNKATTCKKFATGEIQLC